MNEGLHFLFPEVSAPVSTAAMSSSKEVVKTINHYKKSLEVPNVDEKRVSRAGERPFRKSRIFSTLSFSHFLLDPALYRSTVQACGYSERPARDWYWSHGEWPV